MIEFLCASAYFSIFLSIAAYKIGIIVKKKLKFAIFNPLLVASLLIVAFLLATGIPYEAYAVHADKLRYLLTPATVCLAVPLYEQFELLKQNKKAIVIGITSGVVANLVGVFVLALLFGLNHEQYVTMLPKSITTAIGICVCEEFGGIATITAVAIIITGVLGNIIAEFVCKVCRIEEPIAKGLACGTSAHAIGTAKALEMGELEGAVSGLAIAVTGVLTVILATFFVNLI
jgi:predicted murein hydrolase (TIGR00659 family)